jgi:hypothetical protein
MKHTSPDRQLLLTCPTGISGPRLVSALVAAGADPETVVRQVRTSVGDIGRIGRDPTGRLAFAGGPVRATAAANLLDHHHGPEGHRLVRDLAADTEDATVSGRSVTIIAAALTAHTMLGSPELRVCGPLPDATRSATRARLTQWGWSAAGNAPGVRVTTCAGVLLAALATWQPHLPAGARPLAVLRERDTPTDLGALTVWLPADQPVTAR